jgi:CheY-like chemotaxis protein
MLEREEAQEITLKFSVKDNGIGISPEQQNLIFQPFGQADNTTTRKYGGTGLGLIICQNIVELMGGKIWFESEKESGSTFFFTIKIEKPNGDSPVVDSDANDQELLLNESESIVKGKRVLLVEDNDINQELCQDILNSFEVKIEVANNGQEALLLLANRDFDVILMDCQMPVMDGYEATRQIRKQDKFRNIPIIAMTANAMSADRKRVLEVGMSDHLPKPFNPDKMIITLAKWIQRKPNNR